MTPIELHQDLWPATECASCHQPIMDAEFYQSENGERAHVNCELAAARLAVGRAEREAVVLHSALAEAVSRLHALLAPKETIDDLMAVLDDPRRASRPWQTAQGLEPVDRTRCQGETVSYRPFTMGGNPHRRERCENQPVVVVTEKEPGPDGKQGSMSLCASCLLIFRRQDARPVDIELI